jgi:hypothetical protein
MMSYAGTKKAGQHNVSQPLKNQIPDYKQIQMTERQDDETDDSFGHLSLWSLVLVRNLALEI